MFTLMTHMPMYVQVPYLKEQHENKIDFTGGLGAGGTGGEGEGLRETESWN